MKITQQTPNVHNYRVAIDGGPLRNPFCTEADDEEGYVICDFAVSPSGGGLLLLRDQDGQVRTYTRYGHVVITPPEPI